jgi:signal peptidase II
VTILPKGSIIPENSAARSRRVRLAMLATAAVIVAADQISKTIVLASHPASQTSAGAGFVTIRLVRNTGANGGILAGYPVLVTLVAAAVAGAAIVFALRARGRAMAICLAAVVGGALGNLADRLLRAPGSGRGAVVDWIHPGALNGSFNLADLAIQFGIAGVVIALLAGEHSRRASRQPREHVTGA